MGGAAHPSEDALDDRIDASDEFVNGRVQIFV